MGRRLNDHELLLELARRDFAVYFQLMFSLLEPQTELKWNWHHDYLAGVFDAFRRGDLRRVNLNMPVRHLKSQFVSIALVTYWLGLDPTKRFMCVSYGQDLSDSFSAQRRRVMNSPLYRSLFPGTRLTKGQQSLGYMTTTAGGAILSTSVGGAITGFGADVILFDDVLKPEEAQSNVQRNRVNGWAPHVST